MRISGSTALPTSSHLRSEHVETYGRHCSSMRHDYLRLSLSDLVRGRQRAPRDHRPTKKMTRSLLLPPQNDIDATQNGIDALCEALLTFLAHLDDVGGGGKRPKALFASCIRRNRCSSWLPSRNVYFCALFPHSHPHTLPHARVQPASPRKSNLVQPITTSTDLFGTTLRVDTPTSSRSMKLSTRISLRAFRRSESV